MNWLCDVPVYIAEFAREINGNSLAAVRRYKLNANEKLYLDNTPHRASQLPVPFPESGVVYAFIESHKRGSIPEITRVKRNQPSFQIVQF